MKIRILCMLPLLVGLATPWLPAQSPADENSASVNDLPPIQQRLAAKATAVLGEVRKQAAKGNVRSDVVGKMNQYQPLLDAGKFVQAEALLDEALRDLQVVVDLSAIKPSPAVDTPKSTGKPAPNKEADQTQATKRQHLLNKAQVAVEEFQRRVETGDVPDDVANRLANFGGLMEAGKFEQAEKLIDGALDAMGVDPPPPPAPKPISPPSPTKSTAPPPAPEAKSPPTTPQPPTDSRTSRPVVAAPLPKFNSIGFTRIFDGASLDGWEGDPMYWSVADDKLVGTVTPTTLLQKNSWITWRGGTVRDFELVLDYRVSAQGTSGIGYRLAILDDDPYSVRGPQADIDGAKKFTGICYEENGRRLLAAQGQSTWIDDPGAAPRLIGQVADPRSLLNTVRHEDWNRYRLIVRGNNAKHFINDVLMSEVHDHDESNRMQAGWIGMQVHVGPPMKIEFRDIFLKHLGKPNAEPEEPGSHVYRKGDRLELEHSLSVEHLTDQTAKLTAPATATRIHDRDELDVVTRDVAFVRHGLEDVQLFDWKRSSHGKYRPDFGLHDIVVATPNFVVRIPRAGFRLLGQPFDRALRVRLKWSENLKRYSLVDIGPADGDDTTSPHSEGGFYRLDQPIDLRKTTGAGLPAWADDVQTFIMTPVRPDRARDLHVSVNGAWGGAPGGYSMLPRDPEIQKEYDYDQAAFATDVRDAGMIATAVINTIEGPHAIRGSIGNLDRMACRDAEGNLVVGGEMVLMCSLNPDWVQLEIDAGKKAIDDGAQWILVDTPMGASFVSGYLRGGFCDHCMANFEAFLNKNYYASELASKFMIYDFDRQEVANRLTASQQIRSMENSPHVQSDVDSRLFQEFIRCQEESNFASRKHVMDALYRYAAQQNKEILFCTNAAGLGAQNPGGHWLRALQFADLFDLFAFELNNEPNGREATQTKLPRGKWAPFHKLAYAIHGRRSPALIHTRDSDLLGKQAKNDQSSLAWMTAQAVEAYAAGGAYIPFHVELGSYGQLPLEKIWYGVFNHNRFIQEHKSIYDGRSASGSSVAMLFLLNERGRTIPAVYPSYLGLAQGFIETNHPFEVVFAGDDRYVKDQLTAKHLESFKAIIVPSPIVPTENQKQIVQAFASSGGVVVCQEPELLGLVSEENVSRSNDKDAWWDFEFGFGKGLVRVLAGNVTATETQDVGTRFYREYTAELRNQVAQIADYLGLEPILEGQSDGRLVAFTAVQADRRRVVVHLVNYDIDYKQDSMFPKRNIRVSISEPEFLQSEIIATLYNCKTGMDVPIAIERESGRLKFTIPETHLGSVVVLSAAQTGEVDQTEPVQQTPAAGS